MFTSVEQFCLGFAAVVHTVLLLVVLERVNRPLTAIWLKWALAGASIWHIGCFFHVLLRETTGLTAKWLDVACMSSMVAGLLLLNCGILHAALRVNRTGATPHPPPDRKYIALYAPTLFMLAISAGIARSPSRDFLDATESYHFPYLIWLAAANISSAWLFYQSRRNFADETVSAFLFKFALSLVLLTILASSYVLFGYHTDYEPTLRLLTSLSPLLPTLIFAWYVFRRRLLPMIFERTLAYGAILLAVFYLHRLTLSPMMRRYGREFNFDFVVAEGLLLVVLVLAYHPLRNRVREGLRYMVSGEVTESRDATRRLSVELSRRSNEDIQTIVSWFTENLCEALKLRHARLKIDQPVSYDSASPASVSDTVYYSLHSDSFQLDSDRWIDRSRCDDAQQRKLMRESDLIAVFRVNYRDINGLLFLGMPLSADRLSDEQLNATVMLVDQFAAVMHNRHLEVARQSAERRAMQQEKLSVLGLLSGSLAHELRNPLSSMRTIATLLKEDLQSNEDHVKEVDLIVSEIDRLTDTTQQLLDFSRPQQSSQIGASPDDVIRRLMQILGHLARQHDVTVSQQLNLTDVSVSATDPELNDILFNLIKNAIEAVRGHDERSIRIATDLSTAESDVALISISDTGPGVPPELQDQIFEPFVTGKTDGTGLGLYLVGERIRESGGNITCNSKPGSTMFEVRLPIQNSSMELE